MQISTIGLPPLTAPIQPQAPTAPTPTSHDADADQDGSVSSPAPAAGGTIGTKINTTA